MLSPEEQLAVDNLCEKFKGHLSLEQIAEGIERCIENALQLYDDGVALLDAGRTARAMSLFIAAMEEIGKVSVLCSMSRIPADNQALWADFWRDFRSHEVKATWAFIQTYPDEARHHPELLGALAGTQHELAPLGERLRQAGIYVDFLAGEKRWMSPRELTPHDAERWQRRLESALPRVQQQAALGLFSKKALEIQRDVYGPINSGRPRRRDAKVGQSRDFITKCLEAHRAYYRRLVEEGILEANTDIQILGEPLAEFIADPESPADR